MALLEKILYIRTSQIPNSGKGLFTKEFISKGTRIVEYKGRRTTWKEVKNDDGENGYIFYISNKNVIDAMNTTKALGRYANDARGIVRIKGLKNNCEYVIDGKRCFIEATQNIYPDSELFVGYGKEYWQIMKENAKIDKQEATGKDKKKKKKDKKEKDKKKKGQSKVDKVAKSKSKVSKKSKTKAKVKKGANKTEKVATSAQEKISGNALTENGNPALEDMAVMPVG